MLPTASYLQRTDAYPKCPEWQGQRRRQEFRLWPHVAAASLNYAAMGKHELDLRPAFGHPVAVTRVISGLAPSPASRAKREKPRAIGRISAHALSFNKSFPNLLHLDSQSSSQSDLRHGPCPSPQNTPEEKAIYKVKRSPSAETEEFLKIDISIKGGTSYLPSEARRVHTPPLPQDGLDGRKRGFFFDYNAPKREYKKLRRAQIVPDQRLQHDNVDEFVDPVHGQGEVS
ncbi:hypothetical protein DV737_g2856, partial [Chaetothyriales sp. CBS 132003]